MLGILEQRPDALHLSRGSGRGREAAGRMPRHLPAQEDVVYSTAAKKQLAGAKALAALASCRCASPRRSIAFRTTPRCWRAPEGFTMTVNEAAPVRRRGLRGGGNGQYHDDARPAQKAGGRGHRRGRDTASSAACSERFLANAAERSMNTAVERHIFGAALFFCTCFPALYSTLPRKSLRRGFLGFAEELLRDRPPP